MMKFALRFAVPALLAATSTVSASDTPSVEDQSPAEKRWAATASIDTHVFSYRGNFGSGAAMAPFNVRGGGTQLYAPVSLGLVAAPTDLLKLDFLVRSGHVTSRQTTPGFTGAYKGLTDTTLTGTATYMGIDGLQPFLTVTTNLPSGTAALYGDRGRARLDPDFVDVPTFGEGANLGITAGANIPLTPEWVANASLGYTWRGAFNREGPYDIFGNQLRSRLNPGDSFNASLSLTYSEGPLTGQLQAAYSRDSATAIDGIQTFRNGQRFTLTATGSYVFSDTFTLAGNAMFAHSHANFIADPFGFGPGLTREARNSNSNLYRVALEPTFTVTPRLAVGPTASFLYRDRNAYNAVDAQFSPAKTRAALGAFARYQVSDSVTLNTRASYVWTREAATPDKFDPGFGMTIPGTAFPRLSYGGLQASLGLSTRF